LANWHNDEQERTNVDTANEFAKQLGFTGETKDTSLQLSDAVNERGTIDNTKPAPWARGLSIVLLQVENKLKELLPIIPPTLKELRPLLMLWIFIPDGQVFHFTMMYQQIRDTLYSLGPIPFNELYKKVIRVLIPKEYFTPLTENIDPSIGIDAIYVKHNRDEYPKTKSYVEDLEEYDQKYDHNDLFNLWNKLIRCHWLMNSVTFGKNALQLLEKKYAREAPLAKSFPTSRNWKSVELVKNWINQQLAEKHMPAMVEI